MRRFYVFGFGLLATLDTVAHLAFKVTANGAAPLQASTAWLGRAVGSPWLYVAAACYAGTFFVWLALLRRAPIGPAFAVSHLDVVTVLGASAVVLHEHITSLELAGAALILAGISCIALAEQRGAHAAA